MGFFIKALTRGAAGLGRMGTERLCIFLRGRRMPVAQLVTVPGVAKSRHAPHWELLRRGWLWRRRCGASCPSSRPLNCSPRPWMEPAASGTERTRTAAAASRQRRVTLPWGAPSSALDPPPDARHAERGIPGRAVHQRRGPRSAHLSSVPMRRHPSPATDDPESPSPEPPYRPPAPRGAAEPPRPRPGRVSRLPRLPAAATAETRGAR